MHTIGSSPARFTGRQIVYNSRAIRIPGDLATSLRQIRSEQKKSIAFKRGMGWYDPLQGYSYTLVKIEETQL